MGRVAPGQGVPELEPLISLRPKGGIRLVVEPRGEAVGERARESLAVSD